MSLLTKFSLFSSSIIVLFALMIMHSLEASHSSKFNTVVQLSGLSDYRYSVSYLEPQNRLYSDYSDHLYPEMKTINYMDFVYAK